MLKCDFNKEINLKKNTIKQWSCIKLTI